MTLTSQQKARPPFSIKDILQKLLGLSRKARISNAISTYDLRIVFMDPLTLKGGGKFFLTFLLMAIFLFPGCVSDITIPKEELSYSEKWSAPSQTIQEPVRIFINQFQDLRKEKENIVGAEAGLRLVFPFYQKYKVEGHPPGIVQQYLSNKLDAMGFKLVFDRTEAEAILDGSLKEFSRHGWGATILWGNSSRIVVDLALSSPAGMEPEWTETLYGEGDTLKDGLEGVASNLETNSRFKETAKLFASRRSPDQESPASKSASSDLKPDNQAPVITILSPMMVRGIRAVMESETIQLKGLAEDKSGISEVRVNGNQIPFSMDGHFSTVVPLSPGSTTILVTAKDKHNNVGSKQFHIEGEKETVSAPVTGINSSGNYVALVIGNKNYRHLPKLATPHNDARVVARILEKQFGFQTQVLLDASRDTIMEKLNEIRGRLKENDHLLIYYAGHGHYDRLTNKAYWQPADASPSSDAKWVIVDSITSNIKRTASRHILIVVDSCYSGTLTRGSSSDLNPQTKDHENYIAKMSKKTSRTLMASGGNEPVIDGGGGDHSVFAAIFIEGLESMERKVFTAEELFYEHIKESVAGRAEQTPEYSTIRNSGHNGGDFIFRRR